MLLNWDRHPVWQHQGHNKDLSVYRPKATDLNFGAYQQQQSYDWNIFKRDVKDHSINQERKKAKLIYKQQMLSCSSNIKHLIDCIYVLFKI